MASKPSDTAILDLGNIGEENAFSSSITPSAGNLSSTVHSFEDKVPDSALDTDEGNPKIIISLTCLKRFFKIFLFLSKTYIFFKGLQSGSDTIGLLDGAGTKQVNYNFWSLSFYAQFFDVDTEDVKKR